jgi:flagellar biosynthesis protein FliP
MLATVWLEKSMDARMTHQTVGKHCYFSRNVRDRTLVIPTPSMGWALVRSFQKLLSNKSLALWIAIIAMFAIPSLAHAQNAGGAISPQQLLPQQINLPDMNNRDNVSSAMQIIVLLTVLSLAPAILIMMTSFTRVVIVLSLLRQAMGTQQLPPNQVLIGLAMFMTFLVMGPTWTQVNDKALQPYLNGAIDQKNALSIAQVPLRDFMIRQIENSGNSDDVLMFESFARHHEVSEIKSYDEVGTFTLIPSFMLSELKTAFIMGFKVYLPFLIIDMVISSILISMGMMMLPPQLISLPFKLLLFVLVDGWHLITQSLMGSFV